MKLYKYYLLILLIILSTIDRYGGLYLSDNILGITVRYSHLVSILPALLLIKYKRSNILLNIFILSIIISGLYNESLASSASLVIAILYSFYIFYMPALSFAAQNPDYAIQAILQSSRILMLIGIILQLSGETERMSAFFYEPSYMSIFMASYASLCVTETKLVKPIDYLFLLIFLYLSKSAAFILALLGIAFYLLLTNKGRIIKLLTIFYIFIFLYFISIEGSNLNYNIVEAAVSMDIGNLLELARQRTGERFNFFILSLNEAMDSPIFGVGARNFQNSHGGIPPANIFFQIILEAGLLGCAVSILAINNFFCNVNKLQRYKKFIACTSVALLITLQIESTYMRAYLWVFFGIFSGVIMNYKKTREETPS